MKGNVIFGTIVGTILMLASIPRAGAAETQGRKDGWQAVDVVQTNFTQRYVTNIIEVRAPHNIFVTEYRTNQIARTITNVVNVPVTNWSKKTLTNVVTMNLIRTNFVDVEITNWSTKTLTNQIAVNLIRTNIVQRFETNWISHSLTNLHTLTLTNWETVVVTRTNWVHQPLTNVLDVEVPFTTAVLAMPSASEQPKASPPPAAPVAVAQVAQDILAVEAVKTARPFDGNEVEVRFRVRLSNDATAALTGLQCRVERADSAVLFVAHTQEFSRRLPPGRYIVQATARRADGPLLSVQNRLDVTRDAVAPAVAANHPVSSLPGAR